MVFPKTKIPYVDLPHGMKNILYRSHRKNFDDDGNTLDSKELSEKWHVNTTTMLNTEVYEQWKRNWLNGKLDDLKDDIKKEKKVDRDWGPLNDVFRDRKAKKIRRMRALQEFRHTGRGADNFRPSLDADEQKMGKRAYNDVPENQRQWGYIGGDAVKKGRTIRKRQKKEGDWSDIETEERSEDDKYRSQDEESEDD